MRVFVAGATGALGRPVVRELVRRGHDVTGLSRSNANDEVLRVDGARPVRADLFDLDALIRAAEGADAILRLATRVPTQPKDLRPGSAVWQENDRIRALGTRHLAEATRAVGADAFLQESVVWVAKPRDAGPFDETSPYTPHPVIDSAIAAEGTARALARDGIRTATLRLGLGYGPGASNLQGWAAALRARRMPYVGRREAPLTFIHYDDAARAFADVLETRTSGTFHVVDDEPASLRRFLTTLARSLDAPRPRTVPTWLARLAMGRYAVDLMTTPMRTSNQTLRHATPWRPVHTTIDHGLAHAVETWGKDKRPAQRAPLVTPNAH